MNILEITNYIQKNDILPLYITYGNDNYLDIGDPKVFGQGNRDIVSLWEDTYSSLFTNVNCISEKDIIENVDELYKDKYKEGRIDEELQLFEYNYYVNINRRRNENPLLNSVNVNTNMNASIKKKVKKVSIK
jgi:hypothetical protein